MLGIVIKTSGYKGHFQFIAHEMRGNLVIAFVINVFQILNLANPKWVSHSQGIYTKDGGKEKTVTLPTPKVPIAATKMLPE